MRRTLDRRPDKPLQKITEHRNIRHDTFVIKEHRLHDHDFQRDNIKILNEEFCYKKRLISEMLNIKK